MGNHLYSRRQICKIGNGSLIGGVYAVSLFNSPPTLETVYKSSAESHLMASVTTPSMYNVQDHGADPTGVNDATTAIQAAISAASASGGIVFFPPGFYTISSPLTVSTANVRLVGSGNASIVQPNASFSGAQIILLSANYTAVTDLQIAFTNSNYAANPAADGIQITGAQNVLVQNVSLLYINGWIIQSTATSSVRNKWTKFDNVFSMLCLQGMHVAGSTHNNNAAHVITNCILDQVVLGDGYFIEDCYDIECSNLECNVSNGNGAAVHIKGNSASIHLVNFVGGNDTPISAGPAVLIESGPNGIPSIIELTNSIFETGSIGISITSGSLIQIMNCHLNMNATHGINIATNTDTISILGCTFADNGARAGAGHYDFQSISAGNVVVSNCSFVTAIGSGVNQVTAAAHVTEGHVSFTSNVFVNWPPFDGLPQFAKNNLGYNPLGKISAPIIGASPYTAPKLPYDCTVYIMGGTVSQVSIGGAVTGVTSGAFRVPADLQITLTYSAIPTWTWFGE